MKRFSVGIVMVAIVGAFSVFQYTSLKAGDYHMGTGLICSDCHTMHYSEEGVVPPPGGASGPNDNLLLQAGTNALCLACHDADAGGSGFAFAPDVMEGGSVANQPLHRAAGRFGAASGVSSPSAHDLGVAASSAPGSSPVLNYATGMTCANCHDAHGSTNYRNLKLRPGNAGVDRVVANGAGGVTQGVTQPTADQYKVENLTYNVAAGGNNEAPLSNWCSSCHNNFGIAEGVIGTAFANDANLAGDAAGDAANPWHRHPNTHVTITEGNGNGNVSAAGYGLNSSWVPTVSASATPGNGDNVVFCGSCHKAHGSETDRADRKSVV